MSIVMNNGVNIHFKSVTSNMVIVVVILVEPSTVI